MANPSITVRAQPTPSTGKLPDGYQTLIAFASNASIQFWEVTTQPPGIDGGEPVNNTTMLNLAWRTMRARKLKTLTPIKVTAAYDPDAFNSGTNLVTMINKEDSVTVRFPSMDTVAFFGYLQKAEPVEHKEGEMPLLNLTIVPTNWDYTNGLEVGPLYTSATGT